MTDVSLSVGRLPRVPTPAGEARVDGWCRGLIWHPCRLCGKLGGELSRVEDYAEHQDEEGMQKVEIVVKEDSSLKKVKEGNFSVTQNYHKNTQGI